jgi:hypothetical protein
LRFLSLAGQLARRKIRTSTIYEFLFNWIARHSRLPKLPRWRKIQRHTFELLQLPREGIPKDQLPIARRFRVSRRVRHLSWNRNLDWRYFT